MNFNQTLQFQDFASNTLFYIKVTGQSYLYSQFGVFILKSFFSFLLQPKSLIFGKAGKIRISGQEARSRLRRHILYLILFVAYSKHWTAQVRVCLIYNPCFGSLLQRRIMSLGGRCAKMLYDAWSRPGLQPPSRNMTRVTVHFFIWGMYCLLLFPLVLFLLHEKYKHSGKKKVACFAHGSCVLLVVSC